MDRARVASRSRGSGSSQRRSQSSMSPAAAAGPTAIEGTANTSEQATQAAVPSSLSSLSPASQTQPQPGQLGRGRPRARLGSTPSSSSPPTLSRFSDPAQSRLHSLPPLLQSSDRPRSFPSAATTTTTIASVLFQPFTSSPPVSPTMPSRRDSMRTRSRAAGPDTPARSQSHDAGVAEEDAVSKGGHSLRRRTRIDYNHMEHGDAIDFLQGVANANASASVGAHSGAQATTTTTSAVGNDQPSSTRGRKRKSVYADTHHHHQADEAASSPAPAAVTKKIRLVNHNYTPSSAAATTGTTTTSVLISNGSNSGSTGNNAGSTAASSGANDASSTGSTTGGTANTSHDAGSVTTPAPVSRRGRTLQRKATAVVDAPPAPPSSQSHASTPHSDGIVVQDTIEVGSPVSSDTEQDSSSAASVTPPEKPKPTAAAVCPPAAFGGSLSRPPPITIVRTPRSSGSSSVPLDAKSLHPPSTSGKASRPRRQSVQFTSSSTPSAAAASAVPSSTAAEAKPLPTVESSPEPVARRHRRLMLRLPYGRNRSPPTVFPISSDEDEERFETYLATRAADARATTAKAAAKDDDLPPPEEPTKTEDAEAEADTDADADAVATADVKTDEATAVAEEPSRPESVPKAERRESPVRVSEQTPVQPATADGPTETKNEPPSASSETVTVSNNNQADGPVVADEPKKETAATIPAAAAVVGSPEEEHKLTEPSPLRPMTRRMSTRIASAHAASEPKHKPASAATAKTGGAGTVQSAVASSTSASSAVAGRKDSKPPRPWELLTPFTGENLYYPEQFGVPVAVVAPARSIEQAMAEPADASAANEDGTTVASQNSNGSVVEHDEEYEASQGKTPDGGSPAEAGESGSAGATSVTSAPAAPARIQTLSAKAKTMTEDGTTPMWKKRYRFKKIRDPKEFVEALKDHKNMSTEELFACLARVNESLVAWQDEYKFLRGIADDEENAVRRRQQDATFENRTALAIKRGNVDSEVVERDFVVKGIRAAETTTDVVKQRAKKQDRLMSQVYLFEYDARDSMVGRQDPVAQRQGLQNTRLRNRPKQTLKAAEAEAADDLVGSGGGGNGNGNSNGANGGNSSGNNNSSSFVGLGRRTRRRKTMDDESRDNSRAGTPVASAAAASSTTVTSQRTRRRGGDISSDGNKNSAATEAGAADGGSPMTTPKRGRRSRVVKSLLSESVAADEIDEQDEDQDQDQDQDRDMPPPQEKPTPQQNRRKRRRGPGSAEKGGGGINGSNPRRTRITVVKRDANGANGHLGEIGPDRFYSDPFAVKAGGKNSSSRPSSSSSDDTAGTADSSYSLRPKRRRQFLDEDDEDEDGGDENGGDENDMAETTRPPAKKQRRRRIATGNNSNNASNGYAATTTTAAATAMSGSSGRNAGAAAMGSGDASQRHGSNGMPLDLFSATYAHHHHQQQQQQQQQHYQAHQNYQSHQGHRPAALAPAPPGSGRQRTTFKIKNYTPAPVASSTGLQAFTQMMPNSGHGVHNGHNGHSSHHSHGGYGSAARGLVAGDSPVAMAHQSGSGGGSRADSGGNVSGADDGKDYRQMTKSEKMSHSMKTRWANGSMQAAVAKRKATLAAKKAAAQQAAQQATVAPTPTPSAAATPATTTTPLGAGSPVDYPGPGGDRLGLGADDSALYYDRPLI
ncbi:hypothetical protein CMQ_1602 [Grosmannia clavigera kw1407]|uniref:Uncharacterized protein n=1 Tax=Grosmannia clavigera (strain kw1407 / UAMH 11150) TaxID=655863 RepID=F0XCJ9_GROCL|nr:uncharacterized protein CMQ_1602 [Grosmannia clavigera kw1407]EFX04674.1 hypothetical protein CMQ_1602 [Grosmannia clavigera kw1407]